MKTTNPYTVIMFSCDAHENQQKTNSNFLSNSFWHYIMLINMWLEKNVLLILMTRIAFLVELFVY